jgi:hypothetical protein
MNTDKEIMNLDGRQLAFWAYLRYYGEEKVIHVHDIHRNFPFTKHLFSSDPDDLEDIFKVLTKKSLLIPDERPLTYKRVSENNPHEIESVIHNHLINSDHGYVKDKTYDIMKNIWLHEFLELEKFISNKNFIDPFLSYFSEDLRLGRQGWWQAACHLAHLYDQVAEDRISDLFLKFVEVAAFELPRINDRDTFSREIDEKWEKDEIIVLKAEVNNVTPYRAQMNIQFILTQWRDISLDRRDEIRGHALKSLLHDATLANIVLPVGNPNDRDEETLRSTHLAIITPEDSKDIFINKNPIDRFRELLRNRMDIEILSPYQITGFVPEVMFFGREYQIKLIAAHPQTNYAIFGGRQSGKTSLMKQLERLSKEQQSVAFINSETVSCEEDFFHLLSNALQIKAARSYSEFEDVAKSIEHGTLLLIDEIDRVLETCDPKRILRVLRHLNGQYGFRCILAGTTELYKQYRDIKSPMYNFADPLRLGPFTELEAMELAREPMLSLGVIYEGGDSTIKRLINLCGRFPNLIQLMCHELIKEVKRQGIRIITSEMLHKIFHSNAFEDQVYQQFLLNFNSSQKLIVYTGLMVKSMSLIMITKRVQQYYDLSMSRIEGLLDELVMFFILEKSGNSYRWAYNQFPTILKRRIMDLDFRIKQTIKEILKEIEGETKGN